MSPRSNGRLSPATSNWAFLVRKFSSAPYVTGTSIVPFGYTGFGPHSEEWARGSRLGLWDPQLFESCVADDAEGYAPIDQHMVKPDIRYYR